MKHIVRKAYWDYQKEEDWLNAMSAKGMALVDYSWCRYVFEETPPGEYIYRIELLENWHSHPESVAYLRFLEESGVEYVAGYMRWVFLRKKAADGPFEIYTDAESKIRHYKRVLIFWNTAMVMEFIAALVNIVPSVASLMGIEGFHSFSATNLVGGVFLTVLGVLFAALGKPLRKKIKELKKEQSVHE